MVVKKWELLREKEGLTTRAWIPAACTACVPGSETNRRFWGCISGCAKFCLHLKSILAKVKQYCSTGIVEGHVIVEVRERTMVKKSGICLGRGIYQKVVHAFSLLHWLSCSHCLQLMVEKLWRSLCCKQELWYISSNQKRGLAKPYAFVGIPSTNLALLGISILQLANDTFILSLWLLPICSILL